MRLSSVVPTLIAFICAAIIALFGATLSARAIETLSQSAVSQQLKLEGYEWVEVQADGLQVVLTGTAPDETTQLAAQRAAGHVVDPARVINVMDIETQDAIVAPRFSIEILRNDEGISLIGLVPTAWDRDAFLDDLMSAGSTGSIADLLEHADYSVPETWDAAMDFGLEAIKLLPRAKISLSAENITVTGLADSEDQKRRFERALDDKKPSDIAVAINISAPRPIITPFTARFLIDETGPQFDACSAETEQGQARILAAARAAGITDPVCALGLGSPSSQWARAVETGMRAVQELGSGSITFSDNEVSLVGTPDTSASLFDKVAGELEADLPAAFTLHTTLPAPVNDESTDAVQFVALRSPEGQVQLRGRIGDERSQTAVEAYARAAFGANTIYSALRQVEGLPNGWSVHALAAIEALATLDNGSVTMVPGTVRVRGRTGDAAAKSNITRLLADKLGSEQTFDIEVEYVRQLDPVLDLPSAEECVSRANEIIQASKIVFAPGSTEVDESSTDTLDRLAKALEKCEDMEIEIGAHSDSQGGEEMNLQLSQARAGSVLNALISRRVVGVDFTAKGYGETQPIADNDTEEGREANRRIEFKLIDETEAETETAPVDNNGDETENE
ncbi:OmpA family protein [Celeribacter sp.]|uniref:OmpA family protein n=1 Tax=Celeribacter sp. TaxID=1890673 RepID=UPI003A941D51